MKLHAELPVEVELAHAAMALNHGILHESLFQDLHLSLLQLAIVCLTTSDAAAKIFSQLRMELKIWG